MKTTSILIGLAGLMATALLAAEVQNHATAATNDQNAQAAVDAQGNLRVPEDYRTAYQFLGARRPPQRAVLRSWSSDDRDKRKGELVPRLAPPSSCSLSLKSARDFEGE